MIRRGVAHALLLCVVAVLGSLFARVPAAAALTTTRPLTNVAVTPHDGRDYQQPSLALDPSNANHVALAYQVGGEHELCGLALSRDGGATWSARSLIGAGGAFAVPDGFAACWNPSVAYGASNTLYYLFQTSLLPSNPYSRVMLTVSNDGGRTFAPPHAVDRTSPEYPGLRAGGDWWPSMAPDRKRGVLYVTWSRFTAELDSSWILVATSHDGGSTFATPLRLSGALEKDVTGSQAAVEPDGTLFVDWFDYTQSERGLDQCITVEASPCYDWGNSSYGLTQEQMETGILTIYHDLGARLDFTQGLGCAGFITPGLYLPPPLNFPRMIERGGFCAQPGVVRVATSSDGGRSAQEVSTPGTTVGIGCTDDYTEKLPPQSPNHICGPTHYSLYDHNVVSAAAGASAGELLAAWWDSEGDQGIGPSRVSLSLSLDGGQHWHTTTQVGAAGYAADMQHRPALSVAPDGRLDVVYYDLTPGGDQGVYALSAANPRHGLSAPVRVSVRSANSAVGPMSDDNRASFGDHLAVASTDDAILAAWTETGAGHQEIDFARVQPALGEAAGSRGGSLLVVITVGALVALVLLAAGGLAWLRRARRGHARAVAAVATGSADGSGGIRAHDGGDGAS